jgi:hypothetical protein
MRNIKYALTERYYAWEEARKLAQEDPEVNLSGNGPAYVPSDFEVGVPTILNGRGWLVANSICRKEKSCWRRRRLLHHRQRSRRRKDWLVGWCRVGKCCTIIDYGKLVDCKLSMDLEISVVQYITRLRPNSVYRICDV